MRWLLAASLALTACSAGDEARRMTTRSSESWPEWYEIEIVEQ